MSAEKENPIRPNSLSEEEQEEDEGSPEVEESTPEQAEGGEGEEESNNISMYDPKQFESLSVPADIKALFSFISLYQPRILDLDFKLKPFIPDLIPAVGDIDAFIKVSECKVS